jgi:3-oxoacyl-[acyl-carrier-protein] synthase-1
MEHVVIVGVGMMTAVGLSAAETAAAVRSTTMRFSETPLRDGGLEPFTLAVVPNDGLPELVEVLEHTVGLTAREIRMLRLAAIPFQQCLSPLRGRPGSVGLCLALPDTATKRPLDGPTFLQRFWMQAAGGFQLDMSDGTHTGRAGGIAALGQAAATIRAGAAEFMVAGGVDTFRDLYVLGRLNLEQRVKSSSNLDGFVPGEGAGFVLLSTAQIAAAHGLPVLARVSPVAAGFEAGHLYSAEPYRGDGLASTLAQLVALNAVEQPIAEVYSSMNGESHWAKEWGVGYIRNKAMFRPVHDIHQPADCYGDTGAASGPLMVALASLGIRDRYRASPALVYGSSDRGPRAAVVVSSPAH